MQDYQTASNFTSMKKSLLFFATVAIIIATASCRNKDVQPSVNEQGLPDTIIALNRLIDAKPTDASLYAIRSQLYLEHRMPEHALQDAEKAIALNPRNPDNYIIKADILYSRGRVHESIQTLEQARAVSATDIKSLLKLGEIHLFISDYKNSLLYLDTAARLDDTSPEPWVIGGFSMLYAGDTLNAVRYFNESLKRDKDSYKANIQLAIIYTRRLDPLALEYYQNALNIRPQSAEVYYNMGKFHQDVGNFNEAIDAYIAVTRMRDDMGFRDNAFFNLGYIHVELKVWEEARDYFGQAIHANPSYYQAYYAKGYTHEMLGDLQNAKSYYDKAIDLNPDYEAAREALNRVLGKIRTPMN